MYADPVVFLGVPLSSTDVRSSARQLCLMQRVGCWPSHEARFKVSALVFLRNAGREWRRPDTLDADSARNLVAIPPQYWLPADADFARDFKAATKL